MIRSTERLGRIATAGPWATASLFALATCLLLLVAVAPVAFLIGGVAGLKAASIAAAACLFLTVGAQLVELPLRGAIEPAFVSLLSMSVRMLLCMIFSLIIHLHGGPLAEAGAVLYLVVFYLATLVLEAWIAVARIQATFAAGKGK